MSEAAILCKGFPVSPRLWVRYMGPLQTYCGRSFLSHFWIFRFNTITARFLDGKVQDTCKQPLTEHVVE
jgi:hypothetical protein